MNLVEELRDIRQALRELRHRTAKLPARNRPGGGGGSTDSSETNNGRFSVPVVETLPAVPVGANVLQIVFWTSEGDGTGDDQPWWTYTGLTRWYPMTYSTLDGTPGEDGLV